MPVAYPRPDSALTKLSNIPDYKAIGKIGEGTFSEVMKMQSLRDGNYYACKQMKQHFERKKTSIIGEKDHALHVPVMQITGPHAQVAGRGRVPTSVQGHGPRRRLWISEQDVLKLGDFGSCRSVYSTQPYTEYISTRWYRAPECLLTDGFYTYKMDLWSAGCVFYEIASLQPLFPGVNELDQISKIHDIIGTPCQKTLTKFKQSRAMSFDFPFKKGSGIPLLTTNLSPQCLSLLHAMVAYDPDERIAAHQALQHPYFQVQRAAETQTLAKHRRAFFPKFPMVPESSRNNWSFSKEGRKQQPLRQEEGHARRQGPASLMELPKLRLSGVTRLSSCSSPALRSVLGPGANGRVPVLRPLKCAGVNKKTDTQKAIKPHLKQCHLPTINRKGGEY
ncbi:MAPK/MAK/MRK overlapping kinase isoform X6 [Peromyscus californicus insignis]|uniref:MAPK/MAK/MRK overlapping kinase isoform X6 n=2 Tax=Peromyscus californicus insignis TaxID=564181 RepID=UPI0022A71DE9|nr:MAPK/MAK/MRK overlapping kinase isoform X6 [Peromyscus californicus insignis]